MRTITLLHDLLLILVLAVFAAAQLCVMVPLCPVP